MLNDRPRKILDFRTPREVYTEIVQAKLAERQAVTAKTVALQTVFSKRGMSLERPDHAGARSADPL
jgi:hypothetical protein